MKNKSVIKQCVGIDCSKDTLDAAIGIINESIETKIISTKQFKNNKRGIKELVKWKEKFCNSELPCQVVIEATGVYHEALAYHLVNNGIPVAIVLPNKIKNFCRSTSVRTTNDKISAKQITEFGLLHKLDNWVPPAPIYRQLKTLCRERVRLLNIKTKLQNQLHAYKHSEIAPSCTISRTEEIIKHINCNIKKIESEIKKLVEQDKDLSEKVKKISTIKGLRLISIISIIAETNRFNLFHSIKQLVCYFGYDVVKKESGTSVKTKARISHKGNKYIRRALYFPAITTIKYDTNLKIFYNRLFDRHKIKMKSYVAVQRKLLILIYMEKERRI